MPRRSTLRPIRIPGNLNVVVKIPGPPPGGPRTDLPPCEGGDCTEAIDGLFWADQAPVQNENLDGGVYGDGTQQSNEAETTTVDVELVDGFPNVGSNYGLYAAWLKGETCGCEPTWDVTWEDGEVPGEVQPAVHVVGGILIVTVQSSLGYGAGTLTASVTCGGTTYGPITMTLTPFVE